MIDEKESFLIIMGILSHVIILVFKDDTGWPIPWGFQEIGIFLGRFVNEMGKNETGLQQGHLTSFSRLWFDWWGGPQGIH